METKRPTYGHMHHFLQEREDWRKIRHALEVLIAKSGILTTEVTNAYQLSKNNSSKQFPNYQMFQFPTSFQAVDNVIIWREAGKILLGKKPLRKLWQFPGGFVDPKDSSLQEAAERERQEECTIGFDADGRSVGCICSSPKFLGSFRVNDPRYTNSPDKIMSSIFVSFYIEGLPKAGDDLKQVKWFTKDYLRRRYDKCLSPMHYPIIEKLVQHGYL